MSSLRKRFSKPEPVTNLQFGSQSSIFTLNQEITKAKKMVSTKKLGFQESPQDLIFNNKVKKSQPKKVEERMTNTQNGFRNKKMQRPLSHRFHVEDNIRSMTSSNNREAHPFSTINKKNTTHEKRPESSKSSRAFKKKYYMNEFLQQNQEKEQDFIEKRILKTAKNGKTDAKKRIGTSYHFTNPKDHFESKLDPQFFKLFSH